MKKTISITIAAALLAACGQQSSTIGNHAGKTDSSFSIKGTINGLNKGLALLSYVSGKDVRVDSAVISDGSFSFAGSLQEPEEVQVSFMNDNYNGGIVFFAENAVIHIKADTASLDKPQIEGSASQKELEAFKKEASVVDMEYEKLNTTGHDIFESGKMTKAIADSLTALSHELDSRKIAVIGAFIKANPNSAIGAWAISKNLLFEPKPEILEPLFNSISATSRNSIYGSVVQQAITSAKATGIGQSAIEFTQPDTSGKPVSLTSFKGKYTLVDFWASWCGPCRAENPNVVKAYQQYNKKGFEILGVSLDTEKELWIKAIEKDHLAWTQVSDLKAWKNAASQAYGIRGIPFSVLLDKNGVIIAKNLRGAALQSKLKEILH